MRKRMAALAVLAALLLWLVPAALAQGGQAGDPAQAQGEPATEAKTAGAGEAADEAWDETDDEPENGLPERSASGSVSFETLGDVMRENYYPLLAMEENLAALSAAGGDAAARRQIEDAEDQMLRAGETLYITLAGLEAQDAALSRTIAALERTAREMTLRCELGQISDLQLTQVENGCAQALSGQKTLRMNIEAARMQLKAMTGVELDGTLRLSALPKVGAAELAAMDLEADLARAQERSYALEQARGARDEAVAQAQAGIAYNVPGARSSADAARYTCAAEELNFELSFRTLYAQVQDDAQALAAKRTALDAQEKTYAAAALQCEQGRISANALADAQDELAEAKDAVATAERTLFSDYRSYCWAVDRGMLTTEGGR